MGQGRGSGTSLGAAQGRITIDTSQLAAAQAAVRAFATGVNTNLTGINGSINRTQSALGALRSATGALGVTFGVAGGVQLAKMAVASAQAATAFDRQELAARSLAGSQAKLNDLLVAYDKATGGAVNNAKALSDVTNLQAIGFAKNAAQLDRFVRAARGISIAKATPLAEVTNELALGIANQSTRRFDQLGLSIEEVNKRIDELRESNKGMTREAAFQEAVLQVATEKYGKLTDEALAQATGIEKLMKAWDDLGLQISQTVEGPVNQFAKNAALFIDVQTIRLKAWIAELDVYIKLLRQMGMAGPWMTSGERAWVSSSSSRDASRRASAARSAGGPRFDVPQQEALTNWNQERIAIERQTNEAILDEERQFGRQRADTIADYNKSLTREAQDYARQRANQERKLNLEILDVAQDGARQRVRWQADLERSIANARADANERVAEAEEDYQRSRQKAARDHADSLVDAAGRLDAKAVANAQRNFERQEADAKEAHEERLQDDQKALAKSIAQMQEAHARQLADQADNDRLRIADMKQAFADSKAQEDTERGIRLARQAEDHQDQLTALDLAHQDRLTQIADHAQDERDALDKQFKKQLDGLKIHVDGWAKAQDRLTDEAIRAFDKWLKHVTKSLTIPMPAEGGNLPTTPGVIPGFASGGHVPRNMLALLHRGEYVVPAAQVAAGGAGGGGGRSVSIGQLSPTIVLGDVGSYSRDQIMAMVMEGLIMAFEEAAS